MLFETKQPQIDEKFYGNLRPNGLIGNPTAKKDGSMTNETSRKSGAIKILSLEEIQ
jgi:hypothetical protein